MKPILIYLCICAGAIWSVTSMVEAIEVASIEYRSCGLYAAEQVSMGVPRKDVVCPSSKAEG